MDSYKSQISTLESKSSKHVKENERLKGELEGVREKLRAVEEERGKEREGTGLLEERVKELELGEKGSKRNGKKREDSAGGEDDSDFEGVGSELNDAVTGTTTTDLKLRIRKLERQLKAAESNSTDQSRLMVLENLLEDSKRMKERYEGEYLKETRERMRAERKLEEIMSGKSRVGDGQASLPFSQLVQNRPLIYLDSIDLKQLSLFVNASTRLSRNSRRFGNN